MREKGKGKREEGSRRVGSPWVLVFLFLLLPASLRAQNALILIQHDRAGPNLPSADYVFAEWIRWPADQEGRNNRILALASGLDLQGELADMRFKDLGRDGRVSGNGPRLQARGYFAARAAHLGGVPTTVVGNRHQGVSPSALLIGLADAEAVVRVRPFEAPLPNAGLVVYEAEGWDDATALAGRAGGRSLIVEYPPVAGEGWSRYWTRGRWPAGVPVVPDLGIPGLVPARDALALLLRPREFQWRATNAGQWGGPNRWLEHGHAASLVVLAAWFALSAFVLAWALAQVMNEDRGPFVSELLVGAILSPAAIVLAGACERFGGIEAWPVWLALALIGLYGASSLASLVARRLAPEAHPLWAPCALGLATLAGLDPVWSDLSNRFGPQSLDVPGEALGAFVAYLAGFAAFAKGRWLGRVAVGAVLLWGATARPWWVDGHASLLVLPSVALLAAEGLFRPGLLVVLALMPTSVLRLVREGFVWNAGGLLASADELAAPNLWQSAVLVVSPQWLGTIAFGVTVGLVGNRFLAYRLRKLLRLDPRLRALPWVAAGTFALGLVEPMALPAAPVVLFGSLVALAYDGLRANA